MEDSYFTDFHICGSVFSNFVKYDMTYDTSVTSKTQYFYIIDVYDLSKYQKAFYQSIHFSKSNSASLSTSDRRIILQNNTFSGFHALRDNEGGKGLDAMPEYARY
jgi:hypothetical protein